MIIKMDKNSGFTLLEVVVVAAIFGVLMVGVNSLFVGGVNLQNRSYNKQAIYDDAAFIMEKLGRDILVGKIRNASTPGTCQSALNNSLIINSWAIQNGADIEYYGYNTSSNQLKVERIYFAQYSEELSSNKVRMTDLKWCVFRPAYAGQWPARVTVIAEFTSVNANPPVTFRLQSTFANRMIKDYIPNLIWL